MSNSTTTPTHNRRTGLVVLGLLLVLLLGAAFRLYNVNWDKGTYHIHPDERYTTMVITRLQWPASLGEYFDTSRSLLNPRNVDMVYFYGTVPLYLTKFVATQLDRFLTRSAEMRRGLPSGGEPRPRLTDYDQIHLVGRVLSALFDLGSLLLLFFLARRLFDWRVGLLASALLALAVLNIQTSHYFAVDTFLTFFVLLTMWFTLDVAEGGGWSAFAGLGAAMGLTLACKVSVFLLAAIVALGVWVRVRRAISAGCVAGGARLRALAGLALAVLVTFAVFRVAQPYAWAGPNYNGWDTLPEPLNRQLRFLERIPEPIRAVFMPNPRWIADIIEAGAQQTGEADMPWGRQWTERAPWLFPLGNMVVWGMGVPLGVAACLGVALVIVQIVRAWRSRRLAVATPDEELPPVQGPSLSAAHPQWDLIALPLAWVLLLFFWQGMQFVKSVRYFLPIYPFLALFAAYLVVGTWDWARHRRWWARAAAGALAAAVLLGTLGWAVAFIQIYREPITRVQATRWMYDHIPPGSVIANEHFDDPLPFNMDGRVAFSPDMYQGVDLTLYDEDTPAKLEKLLDTLDQADYISMSSGRLHTSIPRLPMRYPVTTRYYQLLFAEQLGFEKAAEFHSYPRLFGLEFNDDRAEEQFTVYDHPKVLIYRKTADYNRERARALLSEGIDWSAIPQWLNPRDVPEWKREHAQQQTVQQGKNDLKLTEAQRQVQEQGGTWASIFDRDSLPNRFPTFTWLLLMALLGLAALPLTVGVFRGLPDRGYILARPVAVLLLAWLSWILTNLTSLQYSRQTILLAAGLILALSLASLALPGQRRRLVELWRTQKRMILVTEALLLAFFLLFWLIRYGNPDLWHPWKGGEKPMDFAYLNAVIKSTEFPPYDPWFAGGYLNYYYFGQVLVGTLIKLIGIEPAVAYNLVIPTWFAMTALGAFSVTYDLLLASGGRGDRRGRPQGQSEAAAGIPDRAPRRVGPLFWGLVAALFVAFLGNLGEVHLLLLKLGEGVLETFKSTIPGLAAVVRLAVGAFETVFGGKALPIGLAEWYWNASRAIPAGPSESVITEFPFFTFLYADLHAHLIAMPLTFISLAAAVAVVRGHSASDTSADRLWKRILAALPTLLLWALTIGAMRTTNTWDVPPHLLLAFGALAIGEFAGHAQSRWRALVGLLFQFGLLFLLSWVVLYRPFWVSYGSYYNSLGVWTGTRTPLWAYFVVWGLFLFPIVSLLAVRAFGRGPGQRPDPLLRRVSLAMRYRCRRRQLRGAARSAGVRGLPPSKWWWLLLAVLALPAVVFLVPALLPVTRPLADAVQAGAYAYRGLSVYALGLPIGLLGLSLLFRRDASTAERLWAYLVLLGLAMTLGVEVLVLDGDIGRMNTVFKFYLQTWLFWGVASAAALAWIIPHLRRWTHGRTAWTVGLVVLLAFAALYPPLATQAKVRDRFDSKLGPGLDGWAYMETAHYLDANDTQYDLKWDLEAIRWLLDNVVGSPVILEGHAPEYRWGARYAINTGLPTILGWNWHQRQQRAAAGDQEVWDRADEVATIYNTTVWPIAQKLLEKHHVRYIVVGPLERAYYDPQGLHKFAEMADRGRLRQVFSNEGVTLYEVLR